MQCSGMGIMECNGCCLQPAGGLPIFVLNALIKLTKAGFTLEYETDIPRQSGLGGSSAMIIAALRGLFKFYRLPKHYISESEFAKLALSVETNELGIAAGLQDRIVQVYGGMTYMDFSVCTGEYERLDSRLLPRSVWRIRQMKYLKLENPARRIRKYAFAGSKGIRK